MRIKVLHVGDTEPAEYDAVWVEVQTFEDSPLEVVPDAFTLRLTDRSEVS